MRPGCHVCARVKGFLTEKGVAYRTRDVDQDPLTPRELWDLFNRKADRLRVPFTALNDGQDVVLGFDPQRLEGVFVHGELGGVQVANRIGADTMYDAYASGEIDQTRWTPTGDARSSGLRGEGVGGRLRFADPDHEFGFVSTERFGTPPGATVSFEAGMAFSATDGSSLLGPPLGELGVWDRPTGIRLGFEVTNDVILAVHRRRQSPGVALEAEHYEHRVVTDHETHPDDEHRYRIGYQHDSSFARWYVDDRCVYAAVVPLAMEGVSLSMGARGGATGADARMTATWTPWRVGESAG